MTRIPLFDFTEIWHQTGSESTEAVRRVLAGGRYILGEEVSRFEHELGEFIGVPDVVGVASGTDALILALKECGVEPGDGVIVPAFTFMATASAVFWANAIPVFADVDPMSGLVTADTLQEALDEAESRRLRVRAIIPVDLYGRIPDMDGVSRVAEKAGIPIIEDACQALGSFRGGKSAGAFTSYAAFSFYPTKNLGGVGDGGALAVCDGELAQRMRRLRNHGMTERYIHPDVGTNSRLDEIQAAVLRIRLRHLREWAEQRQRARTIYDEAFRQFVPPERAFPLMEPDDAEAALHLYVIRVPRERDRVREHLAQRGIESGVYYPVILPDQEAVAKRLPWAKGRSYPGARTLANEVLALPFFVGISEDQIQEVVTEVARAVSS